MSTTEDIHWEISGPVAKITLDRPGARNAMTGSMLRAVHGVLTDIADRDDVRIVELTGAGGRFFCPGADLESRAEGAATETVDVKLLRVPVLLHEMPQVTIAAINGSCAGAGLGWACACDLRISAAGARYNTAFLDVGVAGDMGLPWSLPRLVGSARARELFLTRGKFDAEEALGIGLVSAVHPDDLFRDAVSALVARLAEAPPAALRFIKANFVAAERMGFADYVDLESERHLRLVAAPEFGERARAFVGRRAR